MLAAPAPAFNWPASIVFVAAFVLVAMLGFAAARWRRGDLADLHEWGLGGRRFGAWVSWFLIGGDLYTAYTIVAVPALVYASGAFGFFAIPYTILIYPLLYVMFPRLWEITHRHGLVTAADFIQWRFNDRWLALAVAVTGIVATMPYIALQLVGIEQVIKALGFGNPGVALTIAFAVLALFTYSSGLRAPALIAFAKDAMIYVVVIAVVAVIPAKLGGYGAIFDNAIAARAIATHKPPALLLASAQIAPFVTLAVGSALALFMYPHSITGILSASSTRAIRRNAFMLPAYSIVLGFIALMGYMAWADGVVTTTAIDAVPQLLLRAFPAWFAGFAFAAIAVGALVPAAVMSIGAANTFTRNVWKPFAGAMTAAAEAQLAKVASLVVKLGALAVILLMPTTFAIDLQLLGGVWMIQVFPAVALGLSSLRVPGPALLAGLCTGLVAGTVLSAGAKAWVPTHAIWGTIAVYNGLSALVLNAAVVFALAVVLPKDVREPSPTRDQEDMAAA